MQDKIDNFHSQLAGIHSELSPVLARSKLKQLIYESEKLSKGKNHNFEFAVIASNALSELAALENDYSNRLAFRRRSIQISNDYLKTELNSDVLICFANKVVDHFYDHFVPEERLTISRLLGKAKGYLKKGIKQEQEKHKRVLLLCQLTSVLRCQAVSTSFPVCKSHCEESIRVGNRAIGEAPDNPYANASYADALWSTARFQENDEDYFIQMKQAEKYYLIASKSPDPLPTLVLSRFYRQTYRPSYSYSAFQSYLEKENNKRRVLSESFLLGEIAKLFWYNKFDEDKTNEILEEAKSLLWEAVDAGYENSRIFSSLSFIEATLGNAEYSKTIICNLDKSTASSWIDMVKGAQNLVDSENIDLLRSSFALGIDSSSTWNSLGSYAYDFLNDIDLAIAFYETGRRLNPTNAIILTNLARLLVIKGTPNDLNYADRLIVKASSYASRSFVWWRDVKQSIREAKGKKNPKIFHPPKIEPPKISLKSIQNEYNYLLSGTLDSKERGHHFEKLFYKLLVLSYGVENIRGSHKIGSLSNRQVDAAFIWNGVNCRVELKWKSRPIGPESLDVFKTILETAEVRGLFISISGFAKGAVQRAYEIGKERAIILIDGDEIDGIIKGALRFETLLDKKFYSFQLSGNPYTRRM